MSLHQQIAQLSAPEAFAKGQRQHFARWVRESKREAKARVYRAVAVSGGGLSETGRRVRQISLGRVTLANGLDLLAGDLFAVRALAA